MKSYEELEVYQISLSLFAEVHSFSLSLPKHELFELGSQIRRSAESVNTNIVEGFGRRVYKKDFIKFLIYAHASNLETRSHLAKIALVYPHKKEASEQLAFAYRKLDIKINNFTKYVRQHWRSAS